MKIPNYIKVKIKTIHFLPFLSLIAGMKMREVTQPAKNIEPISPMSDLSVQYKLSLSFAAQLCRKFSAFSLASK